MVLAHNVRENRRTTDIQISQDITFENMLLADRTLDGLKECGFYKPSPIQLHGIPLGKCGFDLLLEAKSGTGKTAVFSIISLEKLDLSKGLQIVILAPTREIASQICHVIRQIGCKYDGLTVEVVMGGLPIQDDINKFKQSKVHILVGSPGRVKHLIVDKYIEIKSVRLLVLDEADKLMEKSFLHDIKYIHSSLPSQKQVILSSATYPECSKEVINQFVQEAQHICPNSDCVLLGVVQKVTYVKFNNNIVKQTEIRFQELLKILTKKQFKQCLIFCNYQTRVGELYKMLTREKWPAEQLYGQQEQTDRLDALRTLQEYKCRILISTDLAARGIDASNVDLVVNFEPPFEWQTYLHRIGRAGRYGSYGMAVTILSEGAEQKRLYNILQPLNISINLTPLWEENMENGHIVNKNNIEPETKEQNNVLKENNYKEFWDFFCESKTMDKENNNNFESFEDLSKSFIQLETKDVKSFSDLLSSFNDDNISEVANNSVTPYKIVNSSDICNKSIMCKLKYIKEDIIPNKDYNAHTDYKGLSNCMKINNIKDTETVGITIGGNNKNIELMNFGLPVKFSSSEMETKTNYNYKMDSVSEKSTIKTEKQTEKYDNSENILTRAYLDLSQNSERINYTSASKKKNCKKYTKKNSSKDFNSLPSTWNSNKNSYENWYSKLKLQVKQIEIAFYIDELNKL